MLNLSKSEKLFERAQKVLPGGVNSPVRAFKAVGGTPPFFTHAKGPYLYDVDGNQYIDYVGSWGPMILGFSHPEIVEALQKETEKATSFGAPTEVEIELAELICEMVPSVEMVRMVNSGTEATMSAIRLARGYTGRDKIIKFSGCYHGHADSFLIEAGSGATTLGQPNSPGVPAAIAADTLNARYNDAASVQNLVDTHKDQIAAIIVEPIAGNMGCIPPQEGFLQQLRDIATNNNIVLIFDEVMTGFRVAKGGAQQVYGIRPDLSTFGKVIGGGLPTAAYGGKKEIMQQVSPSGPVYQAGTLSGNPLAMRAGLETLKRVNARGFYEKLEEKAALLAKGVSENLERLDLPFYTTRVGSMGCLFFNDKPVHNYDDAKASDTEAYGRYFHAMLHNGVYIAPAQFEAWFISASHSEDDIAQTVERQFDALKRI